jgi:hypothetical protein
MTARELVVQVLSACHDLDSQVMMEWMNTDGSTAIQDVDEVRFVSGELWIS